MLDTTFESLLGLDSKTQFVDRYFLQFPYVRVAGFQELDAFGWGTLKGLYASRHVDLLITHSGAPVSESPKTWHEMDALLQNGHTLRIRHAERQSAAYFQLALAFHRTFESPIDCHVYATAPDSIGLHWHYDAEDVFVLQIQGAKEWRLRKNTVNPWPLIDTLPGDMQFEVERSASMECLLNPGDWLYIPAGYWHATRAVSQSLSISVGVQPPTAVDLLDNVRSQLLNDLRWRQRLRAPNDASEWRNQNDEALRGLLRDLTARMQGPNLLASFLEGWKERSTPRPPECENE